MRKISIYIGVLAFVCTACGNSSSATADANYPDEDAVYEDEPIDLKEAEIIQPDDEEAYEKYGVHPCDEEYGEVEEGEYDGPSDVDLVDIEITESYQIDLLMDNFDADAETLQMLFENRETSTTQQIIDRLSHIVRIADKMNEGAVAGLMTEKQLNRFQKQTESFEMLCDYYKEIFNDEN